VYDVGSGLLEHHGRDGMPAGEPNVRDSLNEGAELITCSGDKLLGGPQAGIVVGRADLVDKLRSHPIARAVRVDKMQVAALESVLAMYVRGLQDELPVHRMLRETSEEVKHRAQTLARVLDGDLAGAHVRPTEAVVGGGAMPGAALKSWAVTVRCPDPTAFAARLRGGAPSVFARVEADHVLFDVRTVRDHELRDLARAILYALEGDDLEEE
jgi:L-seryl-tRNA(Ser) seleniumtransferase